MELLRKVPEEAMVAAFLKAEFASPRFGADLREAMRSWDVADAAITHPDIANAHENELRAAVLGAYRGYRQGREMFQDVPENLTWYEAELSRAEIADLRYVDYSYWNELTDHTHLVKNAVANIRKGRIIFGVPNDRFLTLADHMRRRTQTFEPMILWAHDPSSPRQILEGHLRATAYALAAPATLNPLKVLLGLANPPPA